MSPGAACRGPVRPESAGSAAVGDGALGDGVLVDGDLLALDPLGDGLLPLHDLGPQPDPLDRHDLDGDDRPLRVQDDLARQAAVPGRLPGRPRGVGVLGQRLARHVRGVERHLLDPELLAPDRHGDLDLLGDHVLDQPRPGPRHPLGADDETFLGADHPAVGVHRRRARRFVGRRAFGRGRSVAGRSARGHVSGGFVSRRNLCGGDGGLLSDAVVTAELGLVVGCEVVAGHLRRTLDRLGGDGEAQPGRLVEGRVRRRDDRVPGAEQAGRHRHPGGRPRAVVDEEVLDGAELVAVHAVRGAPDRGGDLSLAQHGLAPLSAALGLGADSG